MILMELILSEDGPFLVANTEILWLPLFDIRHTVDVFIVMIIEIMFNHQVAQKYYHGM